MNKVLLMLFILNFTLIFEVYSKEYFYEDLQNELKNLKQDESKVANIKDLVWQKEGGMFSLDSGKMYFMQPINNRISVAIFIGKGSFAFTPPTKVEQVQLERLMKTKFFQTEFEAMVLFFTDSTYEFIKDNYGIQSGSIPDKVGDLYTRASKYIMNFDDKEINFSIARAFLPTTKTNFSLLMMWENIGRLMEYPYIWSIDPKSEQEVSFMRGNWHAGSTGYYLEFLNQFKRINTPQNEYQVRENKKKIIIEKYSSIITDTTDKNTIDDLDFNKKDIFVYLLNKIGPNNFSIDETEFDETELLKKNKIMEFFKTTIKFKSSLKYLEWLDIVVPNNVQIKSITDEKNNTLYFHDCKINDNFFIKLKEPITDTANHELIFHYIVYGIGVHWFPKYNNFDSAYYDLTYIINKNSEIFTIPDIKEELSDNQFRIYKTSSSKKIITPQLLYQLDNSMNYIEDSLQQFIKFYYKNIPNAENTIKYIIDTYNFFSKIFGKCSNEQLIVEVKESNYYSVYTDMGLENIVSLHNDYYASADLSKIWWEMNTFTTINKDEWLSGSLSNYSGLLFTQIALQNNEEIFSELRKSKIILFKLISETGIENQYPIDISLGKINNNQDLMDSFDHLINRKGAWVLHMLRNMMVNFQTIDDTKFFTMLRDFYQTYKGKSASTADFLGIVSKHFGKDMSWFFDQWVDDYKLPTYTYGYTTEQTPEGKWKVTVKVKQEGVNEKFMMPVPLKIDYGDDKFSIVRVNVNKPFQEISLPLLPIKPKEIQFNAYESVLCEVKYDDFEDIQP